MEELFGLYSVLDTRTRFYSDRYNLEISQNLNNKYEFILELTSSGQFGSTGLIWQGNCKLDKKQLILNVKKETEWRDLAVTDERQEYTSDSSETYKADIIHKEKNTEIKIYKENKEILLSKLMGLNKNELYSVTYWIVDSVLKKYQLSKSMSIHDKVPNWSIKALLIKDINPIIYEGNDATEIIVEYDLYTEKEQKKENKDDLKKEHQQAKGIFNKRYKILKFDVIK